MRPGDVAHIDDLARACGWFSGELVEQPSMARPINGGHLCTHSDQRERRKTRAGGEVGCCYDFSCPIAYSLSPADDERDARLLREAGFDPAECADDFVQLHSHVRAAPVEPGKEPTP